MLPGNLTHPKSRAANHAGGQREQKLGLWAYPGQIPDLHYDVCKETVRKVLRKHNLERAPGRDSQGTWSEFLKRHGDVIWATDLFTKTVLTMKGPVTFYVCVFIQPWTRKVVRGGITSNPNAEFMKQMARNLTGFELADAKFIIRDGEKKSICRLTPCFPKAWNLFCCHQEVLI